MAMTYNVAYLYHDERYQSKPLKGMVMYESNDYGKREGAYFISDESNGEFSNLIYEVACGEGVLHVPMAIWFTHEVSFKEVCKAARRGHKEILEETSDAREQLYNMLCLSV